jgi:hypothetical protein
MDFDNCWNAVVKPSNAMRQSITSLISSDRFESRT